MDETFDRLYRGYAKVLRGFGLVAGWCTFAMMLLVVANSLMRKLLNQPLEGTLEITEAMLPVMVFFSLAFTQLHKGHIRVILVTRHLPALLQRLLLIAALLIGAGLFGWATVATGGYAWESWLVRENAWGAIRFPIYPVKFVISFGVALLAAQFALDAVREALAMRRDSPPPEERQVAETEI